jgi:hypothetical protein
VERSDFVIVIAEKMIEVGRGPLMYFFVFILTAYFQVSPDGDGSENQFSGKVEEKWVGVAADEEE